MKSTSRQELTEAHGRILTAWTGIIRFNETHFKNGTDLITIAGTEFRNWVLNCLS